MADAVHEQRLNMAVKPNAAMMRVQEVASVPVVATIEVGTVTTGEPGADASVTNSGTKKEAVLDFVIPRGATGNAGADGVIFTPSVSADGVLSWTNDGERENPASVSIKGPPGIQGVPGSDYVLTDADKADIAADVIENGVEATLGDAESDLYICTVTGNVLTGFTSDKDPTEIKAASDAGKVVIAKVSANIYLLSVAQGNASIFTREADAVSYRLAVGADKTATVTNTTLQKKALVNNLEANKTSSTSYPSAKAVYDAIPHPEAKTDGQTQPVGVDANGKLWTQPGGGSSGGTNLSLGMTSAAVGQIAKITAVDADGKPTAWSPVDMPTGGGSELWETINVMTLADAVNTVTVNEDSGGNAIALKKVRILIVGSATAQQDLFLNNHRYIRAGAVGTAASIGAFAAEPFCGKMYCFAAPNNTANYAATNQQVNIFSSELTITEIKLIVNNSGTFSAGTKFTVQGVRA